MLSYALGGVRTKKHNSIDEMDPESREDESAINDRKRYLSRWSLEGGGFRDKEFSVTKELQKYQSTTVNQKQVKKLAMVLNNNNLNVKMLVAADYWFRGNDNPKIFLTEMYSSENLPFIQMARISFPEKEGLWDRDSLLTLTSYAHFLRENVYKYFDDIEVIDDNDSQYEYDNQGENWGDDDY